ALDLDQQTVRPSFLSSADRRRTRSPARPDLSHITLRRRRAMRDPTIGWIPAIIIGGIAGWLAEQFMKSDMGLIMNIVLGIVGAAVASAILQFFGIALGGWIGYLIAGFIGACLLIWIVRLVQGSRRPA